MEDPKSSIGEEASAMKDRAVGAAKDKFGEATGNPESRAPGRSAECQRPGPTGRQRRLYQLTDDGYVTSFYDDPTVASTAYSRLRERDYAAEDIDVVMSDQTRDKYFADTEMGTKAAEGLGVGGVVGGGVGAALAAIFAVGSAVAVPGLGLVVAGPIAAALAGAGAGAAAGGLIGAMVGAGIPEERAKLYDEGVRKGGVLIGARAKDAAAATELNRELSSYREQHARTLVTPASLEWPTKRGPLARVRAATLVVATRHESTLVLVPFALPTPAPSDCFGRGRARCVAAL